MPMCRSGSHSDLTQRDFSGSLLVDIGTNTGLIRPYSPLRTAEKQFQEMESHGVVVPRIPFDATWTAMGTRFEA